MPANIPQHLIEKHKQGVEKLTFYGMPVVDLDRDGLLAFANLCAQELEDLKSRLLGMRERPAFREFEFSEMIKGRYSLAKGAPGR